MSLKVDSSDLTGLVAEVRALRERADKLVGNVSAIRCPGGCMTRMKGAKQTRLQDRDVAGRFNTALKCQTRPPTVRRRALQRSRPGRGSKPKE